MFYIFTTILQFCSLKSINFFPQKGLLTIITNLCEDLIRISQMGFASEAVLLNKCMELLKD